MDDRLMTVKQLATYLSVNERTVLKLVQEGALPGVKVGNQWRFRKAMIDTWLDDQMLGITPRHVEPARSDAPRRMLALASCFEASHVLPELVGQEKPSVVVELATHAERLGLVRDGTWFVGALIQRESVMPSAIGNGLAFLHTLRRHPEQVVKPFMVLGRSREGIDFDALDGKPTHLFFVLGLKYDELHLPWLAKLVQMLAQKEVVPSLLKAADAGAIHALLVDAERKLEPALAAGA
ncbi:MAG TPA: PTS sugar transporter subunit IIA [Polyangiaceae bacterium]|jgi:excisionase family DNA binding protein